MSAPAPSGLEAFSLGASLRVEALRSTGLLAERRVESWDRLGRVAAHVAQAMVLVCLANEDDLVVMSACSSAGESVRVDRTPLSRSLARHVVGGGLPLVVSDARVDSRLPAADRQAPFGVVGYAGFPLRLPDGPVVGCLAAVSDRPRTWGGPVLARLEDLAGAAEIELVLRRSRREAESAATLARTIMDAATCALVLLTDHQGRVVLASSGVEDALGWPAGELVGASLDVLLDTGSCPGKWLREVTDRPGIEQTLRRRDGVELPASVVVTRTGERPHPSYCLTAVDLTARHRGERVLQDVVRKQVEAVRRLEELDRAKSEFIANTSHELRTPVTSILGYTSMLGAGAFGPLTPRQAEAVDRVERNSHRLRRLLDDLLMLSNVEAGRFAITAEATDVQDLGVRAFRGVQKALEGRDLRLELALPEGKVWADPSALERVLVNLLDNAVKYTADGGSVTLAARVEEEAVVLEVADTGIGIAEEEQEGLFTRFYRASSHRDLAIEGTGLGLAICKALVDAHNGTIRVRSTVREGTKVEVTLPHGG